jgi:alkanesulfonate monooxygenase SsuD/methylene tetrahydromethanopterin reductase-like flavin-dependent oxidoreductase (luciferase family)
MWTEDYPVFHGKSYTIDKPINEPKGVQKPYPPFWIGGGGEKVTLKLVAQWADGCNFGEGDPETIRQKIQVLHRHCEALERDPKEITVSTSLQDIHLLRAGEDPGRAAEWTGGRVTLDQYQSRYKGVTADQLSTEIEQVVEAGANYVLVYLAGLAYDQEMLYRFAQEVIPRFG